MSLKSGRKKRFMKPRFCSIFSSSSGFIFPCFRVWNSLYNPITMTALMKPIIQRKLPETRVPMTAPALWSAGSTRGNCSSGNNQANDKGNDYCGVPKAKPCAHGYMDVFLLASVFLLCYRWLRYDLHLLHGVSRKRMLLCLSLQGLQQFCL